MLKAIAELVAATYGSKKGLLQHWWNHPSWRNFSWAIRPSDGPRVSRLVFVCQGNICRSAMAIAVAERFGTPAVSYGLDTRDGKEAEPRMVNAARGLGYDLQDHGASRIENYHPLPGDLVCLMEPAHLTKFLEACPRERTNTTLLGLWHQSPRAYIHDPLCCSDNYFNYCSAFIEQAVKRLVQAVESERPSGIAPSQEYISEVR